MRPLYITSYSCNWNYICLKTWMCKSLREMILREARLSSLEAWIRRWQRKNTPVTGQPRVFWAKPRWKLWSRKQFHLQGVLLGFMVRTWETAPGWVTQRSFGQSFYITAALACRALGVCVCGSGVLYPPIFLLLPALRCACGQAISHQHCVHSAQRREAGKLLTSTPAGWADSIKLSADRVGVHCDAWMWGTWSSVHWGRKHWQGNQEPMLGITTVPPEDRIVFILLRCTKYHGNGPIHPITSNQPAESF